MMMMTTTTMMTVIMMIMMMTTTTTMLLLLLLLMMMIIIINASSLLLLLLLLLSLLLLLLLLLFINIIIFFYYCRYYTCYLSSNDVPYILLPTHDSWCPVLSTQQAIGQVPFIHSAPDEWPRAQPNSHSAVRRCVDESQAGWWSAKQSGEQAG